MTCSEGWRKNAVARSHQVAAWVIHSISICFGGQVEERQEQLSAAEGVACHKGNLQPDQIAKVSCLQ